MWDSCLCFIGNVLLYLTSYSSTSDKEHKDNLIIYFKHCPGSFSGFCASLHSSPLRLVSIFPSVYISNLEGTLFLLCVVAIRVPDELWTEVRDIVQETGVKTIPKENKCKKAKWLSEEALKIAVKRREVKSKGEKGRYSHLNAEFQRIARRDKKAFLGDQRKEIEENNRMGKTRDLFKKIRDSKGTFHAKLGSIKDRHVMDPTEAEYTKKWQEYTEELYKKDLHDPDNHNGVITHLEPDILEYEVKWALESITTNKASGGDGIPVELFQILKDDAVKVLHWICQQIWKTQQWPQDWKRSVFIPVPKNTRTTTQLHSSHTLVK